MFHKFTQKKLKKNQILFKFKKYKTKLSKILKGIINVIILRL